MRNQPVTTFLDVVKCRNIKLAKKWYHNRYCSLYGAQLKQYDNCEKDELEICARITRNLTGDKEL